LKNKYISSQQKQMVCIFFGMSKLLFAVLLFSVYQWLPWQQQQNHKFNRKTTLAKTYARNPSPVMVFQAFQDQMACRECLAFRGCKVHREGMELKDRLVTREHKECRVQKESEVLSGLVGRVGHQE